MQMTRIKEGDLMYMGFWFMLVGMIVYLLARIELNTRKVDICSIG